MGGHGQIQRPGEGEASLGTRCTTRLVWSTSLSLPVATEETVMATAALGCVRLRSGRSARSVLPYDVGCYSGKVQVLLVSGPA